METRHRELAKSFAQSGYTVAVITTSFHHGRKEYLYDETIRITERAENVYYAYLHSGPSYQSNGSGRILNMLDFCRLVRKHHKKIAEKTGAPGYIIASSAPPFVWEPGYSLAKKYNAKFVVEIKDIWPLALVKIQGVSPVHPLVILLRIIEKRAYKHADIIVTTMQYAWKHICKINKDYKDKVFWMPNGINTKQADEWFEENKTLPPELEQYLSENWCCIYIGSFARSEHVDLLIDAVSGLADEDVCFAVIGEGQEREKLQALIDSKHITNVKIFPFLERKYILTALYKAKCCLAACKNVGMQQYGLSMYKLSEYLYSGTPTVFAFDLESVVSDAGHYTVPYDDAEKLRSTIISVKNLDQEALDELSRKGKEEIIKHYDLQNVGKDYLKVLESK
ncbi:MAG: glycosyltransferase family 4 protein [Ruminococcus sp.]|nr:glycosyltransferase family 4 protein [Ruminococcus sp.]